MTSTSRTIVLALTLPLMASSASAQGSPDVSTRRELLQRAVAARDAGDHARALALFEEAGRIQMRPGLRMSLAQEHLALGHGLDACEAASACVTDVQADLASPESGRVMQGCAALVTEACAPFGRLHLTMDMPVPAGLRVEVRGRAVDLASGAATLYAEAGDAEVRATAPGRDAFAGRVTVQRGSTATLAVSLPSPAASNPASLAATPVPPTPLATLPRTAPTNPHPAAPAPVARGGIASQWWFWTALGAVVVGGTVAALAAGGVFNHTADPVGGTAYTVNAIDLR